ncbi:hypothetical protein ELI_4521 [Eubacterium callanderi]|uniref:Uncharacterized protein n=1 Tax=Eubacterium callanderi TaxID=53442 RepID=E3GR13_9FIRM|nr:hypothetical protein ELI_4521 [Eubacterium callanderi]
MMIESAKPVRTFNSPFCILNSPLAVCKILSLKGKCQWISYPD